MSDMLKSKILNLVKQADPANPLQYVRDIVKDYALESACGIIQNCKECEICKQYKELPRGNTNAPIMVIGGVPEELNTFQEYAFNYGESKRIMDILIDYCELDESAFFFTNALQCFPSKTIGIQEVERVASKKEIHNCSTFIDYLIEIVQPLVIITMGPIALNFFATNTSLSTSRGEWFEIKGIPAISTYHPASFAKSRLDEEIIDMQKTELTEDFLKVVDYISEKYPDINIRKED